MTVLKVLTYPHVLLKKKALPVEKFSSDLKNFSEKMIATMEAQEGIGLAAPQVGISRQVIVVDVGIYEKSDDENAKSWIGTTHFLREGVEAPIQYPLVLVNPRIVHSEKEIEFPFDGCLSLPGASGYRTRRFAKVKVEAKSLEGASLSIETDGILSICLQHEMDHLDGVLFIDRLIDVGEREAVVSEMTDFEQSSEYRKKLKKLKPVDARTLSLDFV
jgi:peptide deformylase